MNTAIKQEEIRLKSYLKSSGLKFTKGRKIAFEETMDAHGHFTAEELLKQCTENKRNISRATLYRCIKEMLEAGVIRETAYGDKHNHFEHVYDEKPHHHAKCLRCHEFIEFPDLNEDHIYHPILEAKGFKIIGHEMHFYGICKKCQ